MNKTMPEWHYTSGVVNCLMDGENELPCAL